MTITAALAYLQTIQLDINPNPIKKLDDILMFIAVPAFCMESVFSLVPAIHHRQPLHIAIAAGRVIQVFLQTSFIIDGLRRCSNDPKLRDKKPGRELVIFLTIANISLWIFHTFSVKTASTGDDRYDISPPRQYFNLIHNEKYFLILQVRVLRLHVMEHFEPCNRATRDVLSLSFVGVFSWHLGSCVWSSTTRALKTTKKTSFFKLIITYF